MTDISHPSIRLAERMVDAIEAGDIATLNACFAPDARLWHNTDQLHISVEQNTPGALYLFETFPTRAYKQRRYHLLPNGALLQFVATLTTQAGKSFDWAGCIVFEIGDRGIVLLEEYIDTGSLQAGMA